VSVARRVIAVVDYHAGNLASVAKALTAVGADVRVAGGPGDLAGAAGIVVPGVGHFGATAALGAWHEHVRGAIARGVPLLGICLGLQWLYEGSDEAPGVAGLGIFAGTAEHLARPVADAMSAGDTGDAPRVKVPHVGWNTLAIVRPSWLLDGIEDGATAYFTHSFALPPGDTMVASTTHGTTFTSAAERGGVAGVQFHPEKSGRVGLTILANFLRRAEEIRC
jgi:imidazole glycerol-phosphate synthase subunit HisH